MYSSELFLRRRVGQLAIILIDALRADFVFERKELEAAGVPKYHQRKDENEERPKIEYLRFDTFLF